MSLFGTAIPINVKWSGSDAGASDRDDDSDDDDASGIARYELGKSLDGGTTWMVVSTTLREPQTRLTVSTTGTVRFRVRAVDLAGNVGSWATSAVMTPRLVQNSSSAITYTKTWQRASSSAYSDGSVTYSSTKDASATLRTTGKSFALVTTKAQNRGWARIYVNGSLKARVNLYSATTKYRVLVWQTSWSSATAPTIRVVVEGTATRPRVDLDAFAVLR